VSWMIKDAVFELFQLIFIKFMKIV